MTLTIISIALFLLSLLANYFLLKTLKNKNGIIENKNKAIESASQNMKHLVDHQDILQNITENHQYVYKQIKEARTDEEVNSIIHDLIDINNKHVHDD